MPLTTPPLLDVILGLCPYFVNTNTYGDAPLVDVSFRNEQLTNFPIN
ncbi:hypothetical protein JCM14036_31700 [Desulfotomaculum defluvii]